MKEKRIKLTIESHLDCVPLVGLAVNRLCSLIPLSKSHACQMELCVVEAVNNSIEHALEGKKGHEVEIVFTLGPQKLGIAVYDTGKTMDIKLLEEKRACPKDGKREDIEFLSDKGRGLFIIQSIMDEVTYLSKEGKNCLNMEKKIPFAEKGDDASHQGNCL